MTNREFFLELLKEEAPKFRKTIDALPEDKHDHKVHDRSREAGNLAGQLGIQWKAISGIVTTGVPAFNPHEMEKQPNRGQLSTYLRSMGAKVPAIYGPSADEEK
ncbi:hypothetical protein BH11PAT3_BH11PAT3_1590 [soil metagenome]